MSSSTESLDWQDELAASLTEWRQTFDDVFFQGREHLASRLTQLDHWCFTDTQQDRLVEQVERLAEQSPNSDLLTLVNAALGFPLGTREHILKESLAPNFTASPNPFLYNLIQDHEQESEPVSPQEPFADDVSAGKNDPAYKVHSYPTKVPPDAIAPLLQHYTDAGSIVLDPFCGTGMTAIAARRLQYPTTVVLKDISPCATHISGSLRIDLPPEQFQREANAVLSDVHSECSWMYSTEVDGQEQEVRYYVWSDIYLCSSCGERVRIWDIEGEKSVGGLKEKNPCPKCDAEISKSNMDPQLEAYHDSLLDKVKQRIERELVLKVYMEGNRSRKVPVSSKDRTLVSQIRSRNIPYDVPTAKMLFKDGDWGDQWRSSYHTGVTHAHHFYTERNLWILSAIWERINNVGSTDVQAALRLWFTSSLSRMTRMNRYMAQHGRHVGPLAGTLFIGPIQAEISPFYFFGRKIRNILKFLKSRSNDTTEIYISTGSSTVLSLPDNTVDYIFTDPPFGDNLAYSELNFLIETWLQVFTNQQKEAIVSQAQNKTTEDFQSLIATAAEECHRVLKPGRWITLEFHNSQSSIWAAIQEALMTAGFVVADVRTLDKKKGTTKQHTQPGTVKQDLIISAYKPPTSLNEKFELHAGTEEGVWDFIESHLAQLPVCIEREGHIETVVERQDYLLYDRMVAFHVQRGRKVPMSAAQFYQGLEKKFIEQDGMFFRADEYVEYEAARNRGSEPQQFKLGIADEASAIQWLRQRLKEKPQTFQELHPEFMQALSGWKDYEERVELRELLEQNFIRYDGEGKVPPQIHSYLSTNYKKLRNLSKDDAALQEKAQDRWYIPNPEREADLEKMRKKALLREFKEIVNSNTRVDQLRSEACKVGFKKLWNEGRYSAILSVAQKVPTEMIEEDPTLLMYRDLARRRVEA